ncbi:MAG TPA: CbiX/SirB N-terminal domain-containing protein [Nocardioides sp.]|nr:CbiX/SirB N-terminal domain-containing protein [Nocardioides sp.]
MTVAHGTRNPAGNLVAAELTAMAARRLGWSATTSYVELCAPLFADVAAGLGAADTADTAVVPLLLSTGYHVRHDLPAQAGELTVGRPLGPDPLLAAAQVDRLIAVGARRSQPVVLVAAGSTDPDALTDLDAAAHLLARAWGSPVRVATLSGLGPRPAEVVRPGDAVSPYLLAAGHFADRARTEALAAGATAVADVIGPHRCVVELIMTRARALVRAAA